MPDFKYGNTTVNDAYVTVPVEYIYKGNVKVWERPNAPAVPCSTQDWWIGYEQNLMTGVFNQANIWNTNWDTFTAANINNNGNISQTTFLNEMEMSANLPPTVPNLYVTSANNFLCGYNGKYLHFPYPFGRRIWQNEQENIGNGVPNLAEISNFQIANNTNNNGEIFNGHMLNNINNCIMHGRMWWRKQTTGKNIIFNNSTFLNNVIFEYAVYSKNLYIDNCNIPYLYTTRSFNTFATDSVINTTTLLTGSRAEWNNVQGINFYIRSQGSTNFENVNMSTFITINDSYGNVNNSFANTYLSTETRQIVNYNNTNCNTFLRVYDTSNVNYYHDNAKIGTYVTCESGSILNFFTNNLNVGQYMSVYSYSEMNIDVNNLYVNQYLQSHTYSILTTNCNYINVNQYLFIHQNSYAYVRNGRINGYINCDTFSNAELTNINSHLWIGQTIYSNLIMVNNINIFANTQTLKSENHSNLVLSGIRSAGDVYCYYNSYLNINDFNAVTVRSGQGSYFKATNGICNTLYTDAYINQAVMVNNTVMNAFNVKINLFTNVLSGQRIILNQCTGNTLFSNSVTINNNNFQPVLNIVNSTFENYSIYLPTNTASSTIKLLIERFENVHVAPYNNGFTNCNVTINGELNNSNPGVFKMDGINIYKFNVNISGQNNLLYTGANINFNLYPYNNQTTDFPLIQFNKFFENRQNLVSADIKLNGDENFQKWFNGTHATTGIWQVQMFNNCVNLTGNGKNILLAMGYNGDPYAPTNAIMNARFQGIFRNCILLEDYELLHTVYKSPSPQDLPPTPPTNNYTIPSPAQPSQERNYVRVSRSEKPKAKVKKSVFKKLIEGIIKCLQKYV